jgi:thiol peroxidase
MPKTREGAVTMRGSPLTLVGPELRRGDQAPVAQVIDRDLTPVSIGDTGGQVQIILSVPSLDTPVCSLEARRFNEEAARLPENVGVKVVSVDLPFAQKRWCGAEGVERVETLSDYRYGEFGERYGVMIQDLRLLARAAFVVDPQNKVVYSEYVPEIVEEPNYDAILQAARQAAGS